MKSQARRWLYWLVGLVGATLLSAAAEAAVMHDSALSWRTLKGVHFMVHYADGNEAQAREVMAIAERVHERLSPVFNWQPVGPTEIVLSDEYDLSNGAATFFPADRVFLWLVPPDDLNTLEEHAGWLETVIEHEYTHILHLDKARGAPRVLRSVFGRMPLLFPNAYEPLWVIEGLAVHQETDRSRGIGRGQSSMFDMYMRMEVEGGMKSLNQASLQIDTWPAGVVPYLYGVQFYDYLAAQYGADKPAKWVNQHSGWIPIACFVAPCDSIGMRRTTGGKSLGQVWDGFTADRKTHYGEQLSTIRNRGEHAGERLSHDGYMAAQARTLADGTVFYTAFDGRNRPAVMVRRPDAKESEHLADVNFGARIDAHPSAGVLVAQPERCRNALIRYDLYRIDPRDGDRKRLTECARYRHAVWSPDGNRIAAVHNADGQTRLDLLDADGKLLESAWQGTDGEVISDLDWSPDGATLVAAVWRRASRWNLEQFSLATHTWQALTRDSAIDAQPHYTQDGKGVLFSSDHGGVYNLRRLDLASGRIDTLTNVTGGAFYPAEDKSGDIYYIGYGAQGFDLYRVVPAKLATPVAVVKASVPEAPRVAPAGDGVVEDYSPWRGLWPRWWFPYLAVEAGRTEIGVTTSGADALQRHSYALTAAYDTSVHSTIGQFSYIYDRWWPIFKLSAGREDLFTRDDDDEVLRVRGEDTLQGEVVLPWLSLDSRWSLHVGAVTDRESDIQQYHDTAPRADTKDELAGVALLWETAERFPLSVSRSHGREVRLVAESSDAFSSDYTGNIYTFDWREFLALGGEHVLALRFVEGWGTDQPRPFKLGGSKGSDEAPSVLADAGLGSPFNIRRYALRGYPDGRADMQGRRAQIATVEWRFPIARLERTFITPPIGLHQLAGTVFVDSGGVWTDGSNPDERKTGAGFELNTDAAFNYWLRLDLRLGYAHGFDDGGKDEVYLHLGSSF
ncbi:MAG: hypothetical protein HY308_06550 [Gammaproteobacteria bacterium]|nr:hypothetical protein [Gammaproteobacteria bacterium]